MRRGRCGGGASEPPVLLIQSPLILSHSVTRKKCVVLQRFLAKRGTPPSIAFSPGGADRVLNPPAPANGRPFDPRLREPPSSPKTPMAIVSPINHSSERENSLSPPTPPHVRTASVRSQIRGAAKLPRFPHGDVIETLSVDAICGTMPWRPSVRRLDLA